MNLNDFGWVHFETGSDNKTWGQFHQQFTSSFYAGRSQKRKKDKQHKQLFALSGSSGVKAAPKHVDEIDPWSSFSAQLIFGVCTFDALIAADLTSTNTFGEVS